jgi:hypothetical protein
MCNTSLCSGPGRRRLTFRAVYGILIPVFVVFPKVLICLRLKTRDPAQHIDEVTLPRFS